MRRRFGAIIVRDDVIISTGYVGAPRGAPNCIDLGTCPREKAHIPSGERYELCRSVHAEANAIINAARSGTSVLGGIMYLHGENVSDGKIAVAKPCRMCRRMIINAGLVAVIVRIPDGFERHDVADWADKTDLTKDISGY